MDSSFIVLGIGPDPRIYGDALACATPNPATNESLVLTYAERPPEEDPLFFVFELLFDGDLLVALIDLGDWLFH